MNENLKFTEDLPKWDDIQEAAEITYYNFFDKEDTDISRETWELAFHHGVRWAHYNSTRYKKYEKKQP